MLTMRGHVGSGKLPQGWPLHCLRLRFEDRQHLAQPLLQALMRPALLLCQLAKLPQLLALCVLQSLDAPHDVLTELVVRLRVMLRSSG